MPKWISKGGVWNAVDKAAKAVEAARAVQDGVEGAGAELAKLEAQAKAAQKIAEVAEKAAIEKARLEREAKAAAMAKAQEAQAKADAVRRGVVALEETAKVATEVVKETVKEVKK